MRWRTRWEAHWIWDERPPDVSRLSPPGDPPPDRFVMLRRRVVLAEVPGAAALRLTADGRYIAWLNGEELGRGPQRAEAGSLYWDEYDLLRGLRTGENALCVLVRHYGSAVPWWRPATPYAGLGRGGLIAESEVSDFRSGAGWKARSSNAPGRRLPIGPPNEDHDAPLTAGWRSAGYDDRAWAPVVVLSGAPMIDSPASLPAVPFTAVAAAPLPAPQEHRRGAALARRGRLGADAAAPSPLPRDPVYDAAGEAQVEGPPVAPKQALEDGDALVLDMGGVVMGLVELEVDAAAGTEILLRAGEHVSAGGGVLEPERMWAHRHVATAGRNTVAPFEAFGLRYLQVGVRGGRAQILDATIRERLYPLSIDARFESSDPVLDRAWATGARTIQLCCTDAFIDCPGREQRAWTADSFLTGILVRALSRDHRLASHALRMAAAFHRPDGLLPMVAAGDFTVEPETIPDASLHWIRGLSAAYRQGGDLGLVDELFPATTRIADWFWDFVEDGALGALPGWPFVEWWPVPLDAPTATMQGLLLLALRDQAWMADALGRLDAADRARGRAAQLEAGLRRFRGPDGRFVEQPGPGIATQHAAAVAVLAGLVDGEEASALMEVAMDPGLARDAVLEGGPMGRWVLPPGFDPGRHVLAAQPFFAHFVHQALAACGRHDLLLASLRRWAQFEQTGDGAFWEHWVAGGGAERSHAHAWSATPTYDLLAHVLGVRPSAPGFAEVLVAPRLAGLERVAGAVPTPRGLVSVEIERHGDTLRGTVHLPDSTKGLLDLGGVPVALRPGPNDLRV
ncbi:MAG: family 78 glycoside hydrolase catalytic domain [Candidatus Dormibacteria bacterium]